MDGGFRMLASLMFESWNRIEEWIRGVAFLLTNQI
jgi:hypothetical protein